MNMMLAIMKIELINLRREKLTYFMLAIFTIYIGIGYNHFLRGEHIEAGQLLTLSSYINMAAALFGLFFGVLIARREKREKFQEVLHSMPGEALRPLGKLLAWVIIPFSVTIIAFIEVLVLFKLAGSQFVLYSKEIFLYILIYWTGVLFSTGILGYFFEVLLSARWIKLPLLLVTWLLVSPMNYNFLFPLFNLVPEAAFGKLYKVISLMNLGEREVHGTYEPYQGLNLTSSVAMNFALFTLFSILLLLGLSFIKRYKDSGQKEKRAYTVVIIAVVLLLGLSVKPALGPLDEHMVNRIEDYYARRDQAYYDDVEINVLTPEELKINSQLIARSYDVRLSLDQLRLTYTVEMELENPAKHLWVPFTLYHGLEVIHIEMDGNPLSYERDQDWLLVQWPEGLDRGILKMNIDGNTGSFAPITENSFFLPASFPWYPVPGKWQMVGKANFSANELVFKKIQLTKPTKFNVVVEDSKKVYSNLVSSSHNHFQGEGRGISLLKGMLLPAEIDGAEYLVAPDQLNSAKKALEGIQNDNYEIAHLLGIAPKRLPNKIYIRPTYSSMSRQVLLLTHDTLFISNRHLEQFMNIRKEAVFFALYWDDQYHQQNEVHGWFFELLLAHLNNPDRSSITNYASLEGEAAARENPITLEFARRIIDFQQGGDQYLKELFRQAYHRLQQEEGASAEIWYEIMDEIEQGGKGR